MTNPERDAKDGRGRADDRIGTGNLRGEVVGGNDAPGREQAPRPVRRYPSDQGGYAKEDPKERADPTTASKRTQPA